MIRDGEISSDATNAGKFRLNLLTALRYELQDADPNEKNKNPPYKASAQWLVLIPPAGAPLPSLTKGKQVLGRYPSTDTFYKARLVGVDKEQYRLRFEGDNGQEQEVDRRYVLEVK